MLLTTFLAAASLSGAMVPPAAATGTDTTGTTATGTLVRATYNAEVRETRPRADGIHHVDTPATIERLTAIHANTYLYRVRFGVADWNDLRTEFMPAAQQAGIRVWVYLLPPSGCAPRCPGPHGTDYEAWGRAIATLSWRYPALTAWAIDDVNHNLSTFHPGYVLRMQAAAKGIRPTLKFYPSLYVAHAASPSFWASYGRLIDGLIWSYRDDPHRNTVVTATLDDQIRQVAAATEPYHRDTYVMLYAQTLSRTVVPPSAAYVRTVTATALAHARDGLVDGVIEYKLPQVPGRPAVGSTPKGHQSDGRLSLHLQPGYPASVGSHVDASTTVTLEQGSSSCALSFWTADTRDTSSPPGYHLKQALVNGTLFWQRDTATDGTTWYQVAPADVTRYLRGGVGTLTFRLRENQAVTGQPVDTSFDDIHGTGCTVANPTLETRRAWTLSPGTDANLLSAIDIYDPHYSTHALRAVTTLYGRASRPSGYAQAR